MYDRATNVGRVGKYNQAFLAAYKAADRDVVRFEQMMLGKHGERPSRAKFRQIERSPLYKLLSVTVDELEERFGRRPTGEVGPFVLTSATLDAIRASMDATLIREIQSLNSMMVLLTIAVSGGPFIGLLGTVVGVMITFAAIAAAGDVNVNAIAPGIAAALLATCAGMFVAIPALFGYNYLTVRIKEQTTIMHAFAEQFITRLAELYHASAAAVRSSHAAE
jgi:biopolymer transport protein ExbB